MDIDHVGLIDLFTAEHKALRRALKVLKMMVDRVEGGIPTDRHDVNGMLVFFHWFGDVLHQAKEESILFPALRVCDRLESFPDLNSLLGEHHQERELIEKTQFALFTNRQDEFIESARKLIDLIAEHADEEERVLFPLAAQALTTAEANEIAAKLQEADAEFGIRQRELLMEMLRALEDKYIRKAA
jgi:hemerythrin-like domain-containing protein